MGHDVSVSVLMSVYNGERFLREAMDSVFGQTYADFELLVVDDASTDATVEILSRCSDPRLRVFRNERNLGQAQARNRGLDLARGCYIAVMDADDVALPHRLEQQVCYLEKHPGVATVGGTAEVCGANGPLGAYLHTPCNPDAVRAGLMQGSMLTHSTVLMRTDVLRAVGGYRTMFRSSEDYDLWLRISEQHDLANLADVVLQYRIHESQVTVTTIRRAIVEVLAAQLSAQARRQDRLDPLQGLDEITEEFLEQHGVARCDIDARVRQAIVNRLFLLCSAGWFDLAEEFAGQYAAAHSDPLLAQRMRVEIELARSKQFLGRHRYARGLWTLMRTMVRHPSSLVRLTQSAYRRLNNAAN